MKKLVVFAIVVLTVGLSSDANQITYTDSVVGLFNLVVDRDLITPQFDSSMGTLNSVSITTSTALQASLKFENLNTESGGTFYVRTYETGANIDLSFNSSVILNSGYTDTTKYTLSDIAVYDGITDYAGTSGRTVATFGDADNSSLFYDSGLAQFIGTGNLTFGINSSAVTSYSVSGGNASISMSTTGQAGVTVVYDYTPIPEPATMALLTLGGLLFRRRK